MATSFVPLRLRSRYTLFAGTMAAGKIGLYLREQGFTAGALLDKGNLYGAIEFYEGCLAEGVKPIISADLTCPLTGKQIGLIALNRQGYANLCQAASGVNLRSDALLVALIEEASEGLGVLSPDSASALRLGGSLGRDRVWLEIIANRDSPSTVRDKLELAQRHSLRALASWDVLCLDEIDYKTSRVLMAIGEGKTVGQVRLGARDASLKKCRALNQMFADRPDLLRESHSLADMVDLRLEIGEPHFPRVKASLEESLKGLEALCSDAVPRKYGPHPGEASGRLQEELQVIGKLGLADYFLVVADLVGFAARKGIPMTGRGSGAGSIVAYLLGITQVDPISEGLLFERFLNELRPDYPDLDIDISWKRRDEVIDYAYRRFGRGNVAMISTRACFETRLAAREVAKAFGLSPYEAQSLADRLPYHASKDPPGTIVRALGGIKPELSLEHRKGIAELASAIIGFPNHSSVHCAGIVVSDRPITYYTPLEIANKGIQITQFDMRSIEKIGLVKIDLLGNRVLSVIEEATRDIGGSRGRVLDIKPDDIRTAHLLREGKTLSCFQLESPAMRNLLGMMKATTRADATLALALVRPGPSAGGMKQEFIKRRIGARRRPVEDKRGISLPVYEEDVMRLIVRHTGVGLAEADIFRRSLKDGGADDATVEAKFLFLAQTSGTTHDDALEAWKHIKRFARYTFSKAHAASFGTLAYAAAYLKANFPLEFYAATLRNHSGMYPLWVHVNEATRVGIRVLPPSVNRSGVDFAIEEALIRTGLASIKHLSQATIDLVIRERRKAPFHSLSDFLARVPSDKEETLALVGSGAFDELQTDRCRLLTEYLAMRGRVPTSAALDLGFADCDTGLPAREFTAIQKRRMEYASLGFSPLVHPLEFFERDGCDEDVRTPSASPATSIRGLLAAIRHYKDKGPGLWFVSLDNPDGIHEGIVPDGITMERLEIGHAYVSSGIIQRRFGVATLKVRSIRRLTEIPL